MSQQLSVHLLHEFHDERYLRGRAMPLSDEYCALTTPADHRWKSLCAEFYLLETARYNDMMAFVMAFICAGAIMSLYRAGK